MDSLYSRIGILEKYLANDEDALKWFDFTTVAAAAAAISSTPPPSPVPSTPLPAAQNLLRIDSPSNDQAAPQNLFKAKFPGQCELLQREEMLTCLHDRRSSLPSSVTLQSIPTAPCRIMLIILCNPPPTVADIPSCPWSIVVNIFCVALGAISSIPAAK